MEDQLEQSLREEAARKSGTYEVRTRHKDAGDHPVFINRLIREDSPYLLQHAHNPVNWYGWGEEAFAAAVADNKPIFLSIGYSTCHWCHVMEVESFDNVEIAKLLNRSFICIKLDREQFPDIDDYYMTGVQIISGQGGWPMSNFLLPDGRPFYAATYFPPGQFADLLLRINTVWEQKQAELEQSAEQTAQGIERILQGRRQAAELNLPELVASVDRMLKREDRETGGLAGAPKFPQEPLLGFFMEETCRDRDLRRMQFLDRALGGMARGGIYDQVAGGFHRYSTDSQWLVPHFEKMLYNQSQLSWLYLQAWRLTGNPFYLRIVRQTLDYVLREMQLPDGGFYSATDADSEEQEGLYFVWTLSELQGLLNEAQLELVKALYAPTRTGNFEGANILALQQTLEQEFPGSSFGELEARLNPILAKLLATRQRRVAPLRDDKLIVAWSSAMATSLAWAGWELDEPRYLEAARRAVDFIWANAIRNDELLRIYLNGEVSIAAQLEDYANFCEAQLTLFDLTTQMSYLSRAIFLMDGMLDKFWNDESGGFFLGPIRTEAPHLSRSSSAVDGATLSAFGTAVRCLALLAERVTLSGAGSEDRRRVYEERLQQAIKAASAELSEYPPSHVTLLRAIRLYQDGPVLPVRYGAAGRLRLVARRLGPDSTHEHARRATIQISLATIPGFHIATEADQAEEFSPLQVTLDADEKHWNLDRVEMHASPGQSNIRELFTDGVLLTVSLSRTGQPADLLAYSAGLELRVQVCSERLCLAPEKISLRL